jgi:hypothetical protein
MSQQHICPADAGHHFRFRDRGSFEMIDPGIHLHPDHLGHLMRLYVGAQTIDMPLSPNHRNHLPDIVGNTIGIDQQTGRGN